MDKPLLRHAAEQYLSLSLGLHSNPPEAARSRLRSAGTRNGCGPLRLCPAVPLRPPARPPFPPACPSARASKPRISGPAKPGPVASEMSRPARARDRASPRRPCDKLRARGENYRLVATRIQGARLLSALVGELPRFGVATHHRQAETKRLRREHLPVTVADPDGNFQPFAHVLQALIDGAGISFGNAPSSRCWALRCAGSRGDSQRATQSAK